MPVYYPAFTLGIYLGIFRDVDENVSNLFFRNSPELETAQMPKTGVSTLWMFISLFTHHRVSTRAYSKRQVRTDLFRQFYLTIIQKQNPKDPGKAAIKRKPKLSLGCRYTLVIPVFGKWRQEGHTSRPA